jgi:hypothetical protein
MMARIPLDIPLRTIDYPADWPDDGRVQCDDCVNRSRFMCVAYKMACHPLCLTHNCSSHVRRAGK